MARDVPDRESALSHCALGPCQFSAKASGVCQGKPRIGVVVAAPPFGRAWHAAAIEQGLVQQLIVQPTIEAFEKAICTGLARCEVMPAPPFGPTRPELLSSESGAVV